MQPVALPPGNEDPSSQEMPSGRTGGLTLRFAGRSVVLYSKYSLSTSKDKYLADAAELGLHLVDAESDFTAFDETPDLDAVSQKMLVGESWSHAEIIPPELAPGSFSQERPAPCEPPAEESEAEQVSALEADVKKKKARRGARGTGSHHKRGGKDLHQAEGDAKLAKDRRLRKRAQIKGKAHRTAVFSVVRDSPHVSTGWHGKEPPKEVREWVLKAYESGQIKTALAHFYPVGCDLNSKHPTWLLDLENRVFLFRSAPAKWLEAKSQGLHLANSRLLGNAPSSPREVKKFANETRGPHFAYIMGHYRQYTTAPFLSKWHQDRADAVKDYLQEPIVQGIINWVTSVHKLAFPGVARRLLGSFAWHLKKYGIKPLFGLFWNMCINGAFEGQHRVHCKPHCDSKNIVGVCAVLVYLLPGFKFNHKARSWLVVWEAGVIVELPPWVLVLYPSSLFLHFNIDIHDIQFVITEDGSEPTPQNSSPIALDGDECGRGSIVFFNEATMLYGPETGYPTLTEARRNHESGTQDFGEVAGHAFRTVGVSSKLGQQID